MLVELSIENLGVIEHVHLVFDNGFTVVTGETGAGKTMFVEALGLVVGRRADASVVRDGATEARIEARFVDSSTVTGEVETILCRVVSAEGRSRGYVNGRMSTISMLAEIGSSLLDIHGQHEHQRLLSASAQRDALDVFGSVELDELHAIRSEVTELEALLAALGGDERTRARELDLLHFQCSEIETADLSDPREDELLDAEESSLANADRHREALFRLAAVVLEDDGVTDLLAKAGSSLGGTPGLDDVRARLQVLTAELVEFARDASSRAESTEANPVRLDQLRLRRQLLRDLRKKYGDTLEEVIQFGINARQRLDELEKYSERVTELQARRQDALGRLDLARRAVGDRRREVAGVLAAEIERRLPALGLPNGRLLVSVGEASLDPGGETVVFMFSANPGSQPQPLAKVASGGELSRVMLALRLVLTESPSAMVFDEVDAGIGGSAAVSVATALKELGTRHQVLAVTHLAQVAAAAHHHVIVSKEVVEGHTFGGARAVSGAERAQEIARMLSGGLADKVALAHAQELLASLVEDEANPG